CSAASRAAQYDRCALRAARPESLHSRAGSREVSVMTNISKSGSPHLADYSADHRMLILAAMAVVAGTGGALGAWALLKLIALATNLFWYGDLSFAPAEIAGRGALLVLGIPVTGALI